MLMRSYFKINLGLHILAKRDDGFHNIETAMYQIKALSDVVEILPLNNESANADVFTSSGLIIDCPDSENICIKAAALVKKQYHIPYVHIHLHKQIPFGAGLGGGSANAITTLKLLDQTFDLNVPTSTMLEWAQILGSDTSFFVNPVPSIATSKGEQLCPIELDLSNYYIYIVKPPVKSSTKNAYKNIVPMQNRAQIANIIEAPIEMWRENLVNDFENTLFYEYPQLAVIKDELYRKGALYVSLSGSGSAIYGIFNKEVELLNNLVAVQIPTHLE